MGVFDIFSTDDQQKAAGDQIAGLQQGYGQLSGLFNQGRNALSSNYAAGLQPFMQNFNAAAPGVTAYANATGANGGAGVADALKAFANSPGYQFQLDQGNQNILRNQAATGQLNSGATNIDLQKFGQGLAGTQFQNYVQNLQPFLNFSQGAAGGQGGVNTGLGNQLNANFVNQGNAAYGTQAGIGNANAQADLAGLTQSQNILGGLGGLASGFLGFLSDKRAKDDIEPVGELFDGQKVYRYRYKDDPRHTIGLVAQEVEESRPSAVIHDFGGSRLKGVDYKRATDMAAELGRYMAA